MTYSGIVEKYREGIGAFDWPEGAEEKRHKICVTCTILFDIDTAMLHQSDTFWLYYFKLIGLL